MGLSGCQARGQDRAGGGLVTGWGSGECLGVPVQQLTEVGDMGPKRASVLPVLADVEAPLPGQVVRPVIISEEGPDDIGAPNQHAPRCPPCRQPYPLREGRVSGAALRRPPSFPSQAALHAALTAQAPAVGVMQTLQATDDLLVDLREGGWVLRGSSGRLGHVWLPHCSCPHLEGDLHFVINAFL
jgi:hypothetical protein